MSEARDMTALIDGHLDGTLSDAESATLAAWLAADADHRRQFADRAAMHAAVWRTLRRKSHPAAPTAPAFHPHTPTLRPPKRLVYPLAAALLIAAALVAIYLVTLNSKPETRNPKPAAPAPIAMMLDATDDATVIANDAVAAPGSEIRVGDVWLDRGSAEVRVHSGVAVRLTGPTRLTLDDPMHATLAAGTASFYCPPAAKGYTVRLPGGSKVVDLGTAFEIEADPSGRSLLRVTDGLVRWDAPDAAARSARVSAGEWLSIDLDAAPGLGPILISTERSDSPPTVSDDDLAQTHRAATSGTGAVELSRESDQLFNGLVGNTDADSSDPGEVTMNAGDSVTVRLDTDRAPGGYDITRIDSVFGWTTLAGGRSNQGFAITVTLVDGSTRALIGPRHWEPNAPDASYWTRVSFARLDPAADSGSAVLASGVQSVTFHIDNAANAVKNNGAKSGEVVGREIDIFGSPTPTGPASPSIP